MYEVQVMQANLLAVIHGGHLRGYDGNADSGIESLRV